VREIRLHGSEGGGTEINRFFLPLSKNPVARIRWRTQWMRGSRNNRLGSGRSWPIAA
jgi:hypothetical protein